MKTKYLVFPVILLAIGASSAFATETTDGNGNTNDVLLIATGASKDAPAVTATNSWAKAELVGGDKDAHGCIGSAGYSYSKTLKKCVRPWEYKTNTLSGTTWKLQSINGKLSKKGELTFSSGTLTGKAGNTFSGSYTEWAKTITVLESDSSKTQLTLGNKKLELNESTFELSKNGKLLRIKDANGIITFWKKVK